MSMDDMLLPDSIESKMDMLRKDENCAFVANVMSLKINEEGLSKNIIPINSNTYDLDILIELERTVFHTFYIQGAIFRRNIIEVCTHLMKK